MKVIEAQSRFARAVQEVDKVAVMRAVLVYFLATTCTPPLPVEPPTEKLREAARNLLEELDQ